MARSRSHRGSRDDYYIATEPFELEFVRPSLLSRPVPRVFDPISDLRVYHPYRELIAPFETTRPVQPRLPSAAVTSRQARLAIVRPRLGRAVRTDRFGNVQRVINSQRAIWAFKEPRRVPICVRRSTRRQVLFARGKTGRGYRKPRWTQRSYWRCS